MELPYHENAWFLTLTYDNENIPYRMTWDEGTGEVLVENYSLNYEDMKAFWKRLRRYLEYHELDKGKLMYFQCGEYGGKHTDRTTMRSYMTCQLKRRHEGVQKEKRSNLL